MFTEKWVEITPDIEQGDVVKVIVSSSGFELRYDAVALQSGMVGDTIRLKTDTKRIINGRCLMINKWLFILISLFIVGKFVTLCIKMLKLHFMAPQEELLMLVTL